jgi:hypothetical protein
VKVALRRGDGAKVSIRSSEEHEAQEATDPVRRNLLFEAWITRFISTAHLKLVLLVLVDLGDSVDVGQSLSEQSLRSRTRHAPVESALLDVAGGPLGPGIPGASGGSVGADGLLDDNLGGGLADVLDLGSDLRG